MADQYPHPILVTPGDIQVTGAATGARLQTFHLEPGFAVVALTPKSVLLANLPYNVCWFDPLMNRLIANLLLLEGDLQPGEPCWLGIYSPVDAFGQSIYPSTLESILYAIRRENIHTRLGLRELVYTVPDNMDMLNWLGGYLVTIKTFSHMPADNPISAWPVVSLERRL